MNEATANIPWLPSPEALARVARYRGCTPEAAQLLIVDAGKDDRVKAWGVIKDRPEGWGFLTSSGDCCLAPVSPLPVAWNGTIDLAGATMKPPDVSYEITNVELCFIELIAASLLPAPAEKAQWSAGEAIAYLVKDVPLPWKEWQGAGALDGEIGQAEINLGAAIGADQVRAWGRLSPNRPMEPLPGSDLRIPGFRWRVGLDGDLGTSPPGRLAAFEGRRWYGIEVDSATVRQTFPRLVAVRAADKPARKPPGPPPETTNRVANEIKDDLKVGRFTMREGRLFDGKRRALQKELRAKYKCSASTLLDALSIVLSELSELGTPTNSDKK